jgi:hypothetical protein
MPDPKSVSKIKTGVLGTEQVRAVKGSNAKDPAKNTINSGAVPMNKVKKG